ncbi:hypothetical protein LWI29_013872 [Acer saccharum]|uniref:Uncharacterized protein n=1 Tax=Acer saccharum TaxID=4024 RepID=A0AA39W8G8_ACESA|nr:hypothetical protein LWI29_013872 [Acer saccharum]
MCFFFSRYLDFSSIWETRSDTTSRPDEDNRTIGNDTTNQSDDRERLPIDELTTPNDEDDSLHDSIMSLNNSTQPLGQSSPKTPLEVPTNPNSTIVDDVESQLSQNRLPPHSNRVNIAQTPDSNNTIDITQTPDQTQHLDTDDHSDLLHNDDSTRASPVPVLTKHFASLGDPTTIAIHIPPLSPPTIPISTQPTRATHISSYLCDYHVSIILPSRSPSSSNSVVVPSIGITYPLSHVLSYTRLSTQHRAFIIALLLR